MKLLFLQEKGFDVIMHKLTVAAFPALSHSSLLARAAFTPCCLSPARPYPTNTRRAKSQTQQRQTPPPNPFILLSPRLRQHHHRYFIHPTFLSAVTYRTSSILAMICSAQLLSFSTALRSRRRSASSRVSSPSARVSPMLLFCLRKGTEHPA